MDEGSDELLDTIITDFIMTKNNSKKERNKK